MSDENLAGLLMSEEAIDYVATEPGLTIWAYRRCSMVRRSVLTAPYRRPMTIREPNGGLRLWPTSRTRPARPVTRSAWPG